MEFKAIVVLIVGLIVSHICGSIDPADYLIKYGYVTTFPRSKAAFTEGVRLFQTLYELPVTGRIDDKTRQIMSKPRCGNLDPVFKVRTRNWWIDPPRDDKGKGYNLHGSKWSNFNITYRIKERDFAQDVYWSTKIDNISTLNVIRLSYEVWSSVTPLRFTYVQQKNHKTHTRFQFSRRLHCCHVSSPDSSRFDGNGGTIAHAEYPQFGGDVHIDDDEEFLTYDKQKRDEKMKMVLIHEIGHTLGLEHVWSMDSIMYPQYKTVTDDKWLNAGDIAGIQALYGNQSIRLNGNYRLVVP